ncbi:MAG: nucleotide exchange factor GrpE [Candidatus Moranbacteria bacterium]|nr:nucleotide exchange factor GrpE [Candidatus Moranbacteria bacterium]
MTDKNKIANKQYPEPCAGGLIVNPEGKILLAKTHKWNDKYGFAGGHIEFGEKIEDAIKREMKEETNLDVEVVDFLSADESIFSKSYHKERKHLIFLDYLCQDNGKLEVKMNDEFHKEYGWYTPEEALKLDLADGVKKVIEKYIDYKKQKGYLDSWKRCVADFENYKKRQSENLAEMIKYSNQGMILEILPVLDNFHASTDHIPEDQKDNAWVVGIMHIQKQLEKVLADNDVTEIETKVGDNFDPALHEAVQADTKETDKNTKENHQIKKVILKGYKMGEKVIRAARVIVK